MNKMAHLRGDLECKGKKQSGGDYLVCLKKREMLC